MSAPSQFIARHAFQGDPRQSQLSFAPGTVIVAKPGQQGSWHWGSLANGGGEGWFPPSYVAPHSAPVPQLHGPPAAAFQQVPMQQRMGPPAASFQGGMPAQRGPPPMAFQQPQTPPIRTQPAYEPEDPFAGLDTPTNSMTMSSSLANPLSQTVSGSFSVASPSITPSPSSSSLTSHMTKPPAPRSSPTAASEAAAALARMGISSPSSRLSISSNAPGIVTAASVSSPVGSRSASPALSPPSNAFTSSLTAVSSPSMTKAPPARAFAEAATNPQAKQTMQQLTPEEIQAKHLREQEEAKLRAQMREEKEEIRKMQQLMISQQGQSEGLGSSGVKLASTGSGSEQMEDGAVLFNPYDFLAGTTGQLPERKFSPVYRVHPFWSLLDLTSYIHQKPIHPDKLKDRPAMYEQLSRALSFVCHVCAETTKVSSAGRGRYGQRAIKSNPLGFLRSNHAACEACIKLISLLPHSAGASGATLDGLFLNFMNVFLSMLEHVQTNQQLVLPGGWQQPEYTYLCLYVLRNCGGNKWSFTVCNTGKDGLQYHPASFDPETGKELKQLAMTVWDIPGDRILDSSFWTLLFRMQVYPSRKNTAAFLYTKLLPALNSRPLLSNLDQGPADYIEVPNVITHQSYHPVALLALATTPAIGAKSGKYAQLYVKNAAMDLAYAEIESAGPHSMDPEDTRILKLAGRNLANFASTIDPTTVLDGTLGTTLSDTWDLLDKVIMKVNFASAKAMDQYSHGLSASAMNDDFTKGKIVSLVTGAGSAAHPLFGRLRRDDYDEVVKRLMGDPRPDPIIIPPVLTDEQLPPVATCYATASSYMQRIADACSLLLQQRRLIKNSPAFAASAAQYALTTVLPMPNIDPKFCFWRKNEMRRETQLNLLFLIRRLCRIYSASTARVQESRGLTAMRSITLACAACVADAICRVVAVDDPSTFALHYSGLCEGPTEAFGIEAGAFDTLGSNLPIYDPNICSLRFQCLDYLRDLCMKEDGTKRNTIFNFDKYLHPLAGDMVLIDQLSINLAFQRPFPPTKEATMNHAANLLSGRNGSLFEVLPEMEYFRDIVFHFKHAVSGKQATPDVPDSHTWLPSDATLHWTVTRKDKEDPILLYSVTAFQSNPQEFVERVAQQEGTTRDKDKKFLGFLKLFSGKTRIERSRLSSCDPNTVVNSCGEKWINNKR